MEEDQQIQYYVDSEGHCPVCYTECETDTSGSNERDSSGDVHFCPKCGWSVSEMALWNFERRIDPRERWDGLVGRMMDEQRL